AAASPSLEPKKNIGRAGARPSSEPHFFFIQHSAMQHYVASSWVLALLLCQHPICWGHKSST
ncbi:MAG: hypothetical protein ACK40X_12415, partial [Armatimonadota bacterium]